MNYEIKITSPDNIPELIDFFNTVYKPNHTLANNDYLAWQYRDVPFNQFYPNYSNLLLLKNKKIVGHLGLIPYVFKLEDKKLRTAFLASLIVEEELRGSGAGIFLMREAEKYFDIIYTIGFNKQAEPALKFCKWEQEMFLKRWIYNNSRIENGSNINVSEIHGFDSKWDEVWDKLKSNFKITIDRSSKYLNWRFSDNPFIKYKIFYAKDNGYIILRKEGGNEFKACRIVDFVSSPDAAHELLSAAIKVANKEEVDFVDFFCSSDIYNKTLKSVGFEIYNSDINPEPPTFILPTDRSRLKINFSYKYTSPELKNYMPDGWFVVKADGDKDRA